MAAITRDAALGQVIRWATKNRLFKYPEEQADFKLPWRDNEATAEVSHKAVEANAAIAAAEDALSKKQSKESAASGSRPESVASRFDEEKLEVHDLALQGTRTSHLSRVISRQQTLQWTPERLDVEREEEMERHQSQVIEPQRTQDGVLLVDWYTTDDQDNPQNWSARKKNFVTFQLILYTFVVYCASAIYTPSETGVMHAFGVGIPKASLALSVYVLGYGLGPLLFSPMSEIALFGRNVPYISSFALFVVLAIPTALVDNYPGLLVLRFLTGFLGSPCLATGGATIQDLYTFMKLPYGFTAWVAAAFAAPALGPVISAFAVTAENWHWAFWEILWMSAPVFILMFISFPETSSANILLRRAQRLRKITGDPNFKSQSEIDQGTTAFGQVVRDSLIKPLQITVLDPAVLFTNVYTSLIYGIYYSFFEAFPLVYIDKYGFNPGEMATVFTCIVIAAIIGITIYCSYVWFYLEPDIKKNGMRAQEHRLVPALFASVALPAGLFIFAWTSRPDVPWIASVIGIAIFAVGAFVLMQCVFMYLPLSYPPYAASLFAANDTFRSAIAAGSIIYAHPLFINLGIGRGVSLLGGLAAGGVVGIWLLWWFGAKLRAKSKFAQS